MNDLKQSELQTKWLAKSQQDLVDHIVQYYHQNAISDLEVIIQLSSKVENTHQNKKYCPVGLSEFLRQFQFDLKEHLAKEEEILFPLIKNGQGKFAYMPIKVMQEEHVDHQNALYRIRELTNDFVLTEDACRTWRLLYSKLEIFEQEMLEHIFLENKVLFVRALLP